MNNPFLPSCSTGMLPGPMGGMMQMIQQFQQFRNSFQGDARAEVEKLLQSGQMTQAQLNQFQMFAQQFKPFI